MIEIHRIEFFNETTRLDQTALISKHLNNYFPSHNGHGHGHAGGMISNDLQGIIYYQVLRAQHKTTLDRLRVGGAQLWVSPSSLSEMNCY